MSAKSAIEWTDASWNCVTGCSKVSQGCKNCYAEREWPRLQHLPAYAGRTFTDVHCHPERLDQPLRWRKPRRIFVNSMSDLFHEAVPDDFIDHVFAVMARARQHIFQVLTKRPARMLDYLTRFKPDDEGYVTRDGRRAMGKPGNGPIFNSSRWPLPNVWLGVSVEDRETWLERSAQLKLTPAAVRFISYEPALKALGDIDLNGIGWVIAGGESGPKARPSHPDWFHNLRDQCQAAGVRFFFKQWGEWILYSEKNQAHLPRMEISPGYWMARVGKKAAGRMLDGKLWDEYP